MKEGQFPSLVLRTWVFPATLFFGSSRERLFSLYQSEIVIIILGRGFDLCACSIAEVGTFGSFRRLRAPRVSAMVQKLFARGASSFVLLDCCLQALVRRSSPLLLDRPVLCLN